MHVNSRHIIVGSQGLPCKYFPKQQVEVCVIVWMRRHSIFRLLMVGSELKVLQGTGCT